MKSEFGWNGDQSLTVYDIYNTLPYVDTLDRKTTLQLRKRLNFSKSKSRWELKIAVHVFINFFKRMLTDVIINKKQFKFSPTKRIRLIDTPYIKVRQLTCRYLNCIPSMPVHNVCLEFKTKYNRRKYMVLYNEFKEMLQDGNNNCTLTSGVREFKTVNAYAKEILQDYPELTLTYIEQIIRWGVKVMFNVAGAKHSQLTIEQRDPVRRRIQKLTSQQPARLGEMMRNKLQKMYPRPKSMKEYYYALLTDEQKEKIEDGQSLENVITIYGVNRIKTFYTKKYKDYRNVYKIIDSSRSSHQSIITRTNVEANKLEYVYRRTYNRLKPINNTERGID